MDGIDPRPQFEPAELLAERAKSGDERAFTELVKLYQDKLYRYIFSKIANPAIAEELVQETFLKFWKNLPTYQGHGQNQLTNFLYTICNNIFRDLVRKFYVTRTYQRDFEAGYTETMHSQQPDAPDRQVVNGRELSLVLEIINGLGKQDQDIFRLYFIEDLSDKEIMAVLGIPRHTIHKKIANMRRLLNNPELGPVA